MHGHKSTSRWKFRMCTTTNDLTLYSFPHYTFLWPEDGPKWPKHVVSLINKIKRQLFILVINQRDAQNLFYSKFISCLYMFRAPCADRQEVKILLYSLWYHHTCRCDDTRCCIIQFWLPRDDHLQVWWYQRLYNTILTSWRWAHGTRNM